MREESRSEEAGYIVAPCSASADVRDRRPMRWTCLRLLRSKRSSIPAVKAVGGPDDPTLWRACGPFCRINTFVLNNVLVMTSMSPD